MENLYSENCKTLLKQIKEDINKWKCTAWKERYDKPRQHIKKQRHHFVNKGPSSQGYDFSSGHVWM